VKLPFARSEDGTIGQKSTALRAISSATPMKVATSELAMGSWHTSEGTGRVHLHFAIKPQIVFKNNVVLPGTKWGEKSPGLQIRS